MACLDNIIEINKSDCIGNSRETINTNFTVLKDKVCSLETKTIIIEDKSIYFVPLYGIILYYGDISLGGTDFDLQGRGLESKNLQAFAICNGMNNTPDMRDRFVVGAGGSYTHKTFGPQAPDQQPSLINDTLSLQFSSVRLDVSEMPTHNHGITEPKINGVEVGHSHTGTTSLDGKHKHTYQFWNDNQGGVEFGETIDDGEIETRFTSEEPNHFHTLNIGYSKTGITINDKGNSAKHENRPPYIALGYIMRVQ